MPHVRGLHPVIAVPTVVDHQHPAAVRRGRRISQQQLKPPLIDLLRIPARFGQEELQPLHSRAVQIEQVLADAAVAGATAVPVPDMGEGMLDCHVFAQFRPADGSLLALPQPGEQGRVGMDRYAAAVAAGGPALAGTCG